jgi:hypothetical protein
MTEECTKESCCKNTEVCSEQMKIDASKAEARELMSQAVGNVVSAIDPLALIAQLSLTVAQLQKDLANMEKAVGQNLGEIVGYFNQQMASMMGAKQPTELTSGAKQGAGLALAPRNGAVDQTPPAA